MIEDINASLKIIVVGNGRVGKTTLTIKYVKNIYTTEYKKTLGVDFLNTQRYIKSIDKEVDFYIWDTAGQDYYNSITRRYYKGADAALIVFAINDKDSFDNVTQWYDKIFQECNKIPMILVMSKVDLKHEIVVTDNQAIDLAKKLNITFMKVSSKDNFMVNEVFEKLAIEHYKYIESLEKKNQDIEKDNIQEIQIKSNYLSHRFNNKKNGFQINKDNNNEKKDKKKKNCCK